MTFKSKITCDAGCHCEIEIDTEDPHSVDIEVNNLKLNSGWFFDEDNDYHYCPKHAEAARKELEENS